MKFDDSFPHRVYHSAREFYFFLGGEFPHWEYEPDDLVLFKEGYYMDRHPGTVHGTGIEGTPVGAKAIGWVVENQQDPFVTVQEAEELTTELPVPGERVANELPPVRRPADEPSGPEAIRVERPGVVVLRTRELAW